MVLQLSLPYFYFQSKENDSFSFPIPSCFRLCFGQMSFQLLKRHWDFLMAIRVVPMIKTTL